MLYLLCHVFFKDNGRHDRYDALQLDCWLQVNVGVVGSSLLSILDRLAFEVLPETYKRSTGNISKQ